MNLDEAGKILRYRRAWATILWWRKSPSHFCLQFSVFLFFLFVCRILCVRLRRYWVPMSVVFVTFDFDESLVFRPCSCQLSDRWSETWKTRHVATLLACIKADFLRWHAHWIPMLTTLLVIWNPLGTFLFFSFIYWNGSRLALLLHLMQYTFGCALLFLRSGRSGRLLRAAAFRFRLSVELFTSLFSRLFSFISVPQCFFHPARRVSRVTNSSGYRSCVPLKNCQIRVVCKTITWRSVPLTLCHIHNFNWDWMVQ